MTRKLENWIEAFVEYTEHLPSEPILRRWSAISAIAGAVERKVYATSMNRPLYPNFYIFLVAPPGIGKTVLVTEIKELWGSMSTLHQGASSLTKASFVDELHDAERTVTRVGMNPPVETFHALSLASNELAVLLPAYDNEFMNTLTDVYDGKRYSEKRRTKDRSLDIPDPFFNFIACTTPSFLSDLLPEGAWDQGFMSRVLMIYSGVQKPINLFDLPDTNDKLHKALVDDLKVIHQLCGEITYSPEARDTILEWYDGGFYRTAGKPTHPKLNNYVTRRHMHVLKLCQIVTINYGNSLVVEREHVFEAINLLMEVEARVPDIFKSMTSGGDFAVIEGAWYYLYELFLQKKGTPIKRELLYAYLQQRTPAHNIERLVEVMKASGMIQEKLVAKVGTCFIPKEFEKV